MGNSCRRPPARCAHVSTNLSDSTKPSSKSSSTSNSTETTSSTITSKSSTSFSAFQTELSFSGSLKLFKYSDLKATTRNFRDILGEGGFGGIYKGWLEPSLSSTTKPGSGVVVAIKKLKLESFQGHKEWLAEVFYLGQLRHENLVKLIGYCSESDNRLLVYEFMPRGSLENHLFRSTIFTYKIGFLIQQLARIPNPIRQILIIFAGGVQPISWTTRLSIAIGVARGISFLHNLDTHVIYRDLKASNILLDSDFNAKLSDFGLARDGPTGDDTHVSTKVVGTHGYAAPEYVATGHLTTKSDVYSFGVVMLELLTGKRVLEEDRPGVDETLVDWAKPFLNDIRGVLRIMDTRLGGQYPKKSAQVAAALSLQCLHTDPKYRPLMKDVLATLEQLHTASNNTKTPPRTPPRAPSERPENRRRRH